MYQSKQDNTKDGQWVEHIEWTWRELDERMDIYCETLQMEKVFVEESEIVPIGLSLNSHR